MDTQEIINQRIATLLGQAQIRAIVAEAHAEALHKQIAEKAEDVRPGKPRHTGG